MSQKRVHFHLEEERDEQPPNESEDAPNPPNESEDAPNPPNGSEDAPNSPNGSEDAPNSSRTPFNKKFKHTLDSDEEDDELEDARKYEINPDEFDGEEEGNLHREGEIMITPFNIKDELKEGHFDDQGTFIFRKEKEEIRDNWIDNIDWQTIKETDETEPGDRKEEDSSESSEDEGYKRNEKKSDSIDCLKRLIGLMNPDETVQRAMQRLGKSKLKNVKKNAANKYRQQKAKQTDKPPAGAEPSSEEREEQERKANLNSLIELSNQMLSDGDMNIYEKKREALEYQLAAEEKLAKKPDLDMFGD